MKEIDTETSVIWPSWCYSDNIHRNVLKECAEIAKDFYVDIDGESNYSTLGDTAATTESKIIKLSTSESNTNRCRSKTPSPLAFLAPLSLASTTIVGENKMLSERSLILNGYSNNNTIDSVKTNCEKSNTPPSSGVPSPVQGTGLTITPTTTAAAAAAYLYLEKVKNERMSPRVTAAQLDSLKDAIMESSAAAAVAAAMVNNNNSNSINNNHINSNSTNNNNNSRIDNSSSSNCSNSSSSINQNLVNSQVQQQIINNTSDDLQTHSLTQSCSQPLQHQHQKQSQQYHHHHQQQQQQSLHMNSNHVKKERLSPGTNGDLQTTLSRSRSTTPSSFRGTSPQQSVHSSPSETLAPMHNLSTNLLNSIHQAAASSRHGNLSASSTGITSANSGLPTDFSTRNYSDFMRSLAAKYNNTNPNDNLKRNILFEATSNNTSSQKKTSTAAQKTSYTTPPTTQINKEVSITTTASLPPPTPLTAASISPGESALKLTQQNKLAAAVANAAAACSSNVSPYMTSFLSSLPFSPGIFPPLIDMSSTQALITLARAAKENEIHNMLSASSQHPKRSAACTSPSPSPSLNMALQQAAQFISPALIYSAQLQKQQLHQQHQQQLATSRQSSPRLTSISNSTTFRSTSAKNNRNLGEKINVSPLDLSSQPPAAKRFKAESTSSQSSNDGLIHTTITRRASSSTATTSPSPPPLNEKKSLNASTASPAAAATASAVVGSSTKTEATAIAFTPIKVASSTSATSSTAPAVTVRQCQAQSEELNSWTVDDVCTFVGSIDICAEYVKHFRDQCIDGSGLPLLTEDHLVNSLGMKLGPALKLRSVLAKKLGGPCPCVSCVAQVQQVLALQTGGITAAAATIATTTTTTASDHTTGSITTNVAAIGSCNSHLPKNSFSTNSGMNCSSYNSSNNSSSVNKNESTTASISSTNTISINSTTPNVCNSDGNTPRSNSNCNTNVGHLSSPPPASILQQQQQQQQQQQHSPSLQNICSSNNSNPTTNRHDNADSSS